MWACRRLRFSQASIGGLGSSGLRVAMSWLHVLFEGGEDDVFGEELGEDVGGGVLCGGVDDVGGDAAAVDRGELLGDLGVVLGPVGAEEGDVVVAELMLDVGGF